MGYLCTKAQWTEVFAVWQKDYDVYAPKLFPGKGIYSDTDCIRYGKVTDISQIVFDQKSEYSAKEELLKNAETLFYFTEQEVKVSDGPKKGAIIFLRSCDIHGMKRLDDMYYRNGAPDFYYDRRRKAVKFVLMGCAQSFENCFCVSTGTNQTTEYDLAVNIRDGETYVDNKCPDWDVLFSGQEIPVTPDFVSVNKIAVEIPDSVPNSVRTSGLWEEYNSRCIGCGRCNFVCPTCTCFTMQDLFYSENGKAGERRRVVASCMVDGYTDVHGGSYRQKKSERMRFKVLHKIADFKTKYGYQMCVGCGRCDDVCPEYISFSNTINKVAKEVKEHE